MTRPISMSSKRGMETAPQPRARMKAPKLQGCGAAAPRRKRFPWAPMTVRIASMTSLRAVLILILLALGWGTPVNAAPPLGTPHVTAVLAAQTVGAAPGSPILVAVALTPEKGWHTYWRNPGDAGEPTTIRWSLSTGWRAGTSSGRRPGACRWDRS